MHDFQLFTPVVAGITGTAAMSIFTFISFLLLKRPYFVVRSLALILNFGKRATYTKTPARIFYVTAVVLHYGIGIIFAYAYVLFMNNFTTDSSLIMALIFGALIGVVGIIGWKLFLAYHNDPFNLQLSIYFTVIWIGHLLLAITMFYVFKNFEVPKPIAQEIPLC